MVSESTNLAGIVLRHAETRSAQVALTIPREWDESGISRVEQVTFGELSDRVRELQLGLATAGFVEGDRVVILFPVSVDLYALVLALIASGMVAVFVDLGMGRKRVFQALKLSKAKAIVSVDPLLKLWPVLPALWGRKRYSVDRKRFGVQSIHDLGYPHVDAPEVPRVLERNPGAPALMTFTSGSTGEPRAANRTHDILIAQHHALSEEFPAGDDEIDMPCFPVVPLHNLCCGITTVMPAVDLRAPAGVDPALIVDQVAEYGVTRMTGAPAYLTRITDELERRGSGLETVRRLGAGGAPTPKDLCRRLIRAMPHTDLLIIYGSTEAEPIAATTMQEFAETEGAGYLVGRVSEAPTVELVDLPTPVPTLDARQMEPYRVPNGEVGEVVVRGPHVLRNYVDNPAADAETKLPAPDGGVWHRTGDVGRWDDEGRLWLVGRLKDAVEYEGRTIHPFAVEAEIDQLDGVKRSALIERLDRAELCVELERGAQGVVVQPLVQAWVEEHDLRYVPVILIDEIPMDPRHNSKVARVQLREVRDRATAHLNQPR